MGGPTRVFTPYQRTDAGFLSSISLPTVDLLVSPAASAGVAVRRLTTARCIVAYDIGAAPPRAGLLRYRPGATGSDDRSNDRHNRRTPGVRGAVAQLGERCNRTAEVRGSTPLSSISPRSARHGFRPGIVCPPPLGRTESSNDGARGSSARRKPRETTQALRANRLRGAFRFRRRSDLLAGYSPALSAVTKSARKALSTSYT
jgi:hypothetical protein